MLSGKGWSINLLLLALLTTLPAANWEFYRVGGCIGEKGTNIVWKKCSESHIRKIFIQLTATKQPPLRAMRRENRGTQNEW